MQILRKELKLKGWDAEDLADKLDGVSESAVKAWIKGTYKPRTKIVPKLKELGFSETACLNPSKDVEV